MILKIPLGATWRHCGDGSQVRLSALLPAPGARDPDSLPQALPGPPAAEEDRPVRTGVLLSEHEGISYAPHAALPLTLRSEASGALDDVTLGQHQHVSTDNTANRPRDAHSWST